MCSTKSMVLRVILFIAIIMVSGVCSDEGKRYCASRLTKKLQLVCRYRYAPPLSRYLRVTEKRSGANEDYAHNEPLADNSALSYYQSLPLLANFGSTKGLPPRVSQRGVADECCRKPCTFQELRSYCY